MNFKNINIKQLWGKSKQTWNNLIKTYTFNICALLVSFDLFLFYSIYYGYYLDVNAVLYLIYGFFLWSIPFLLIKFLTFKGLSFIEKKFIKKEITSKFILENKFYAFIIFLSYFIQLTVIVTICMLTLLYFYETALKEFIELTISLIANCILIVIYCIIIAIKYVLCFIIDIFKSYL